MADPSALARGRIRTHFRREGLPALGGPPGSSRRHHGARRLKGPSRVVE